MMKKIIILAAVLIALFASWSLIANTDKAKIDVLNKDVVTNQEIKSIDVNNFKVRLATKEYIIIDLRTRQEIAEGKINPEALEIDFYAADFKNNIALLDKGKKYLLYCRSGNRSGQTLRLMKSLGFVEVYDLAGGKTTWEASL